MKWIFGFFSSKAEETFGADANQQDGFSTYF